MNLAVLNIFTNIFYLHQPMHPPMVAAVGGQTTDDGMSVCKIDHPTIRNSQSAIRNSSSGQAMAEYVIIAGLLMAALGILTVFFVTFKEYGGRILALVSSEYP